MVKSSFLIPLFCFFLLSSCTEHVGKLDNSVAVKQFYDNISVIVNDPNSDDAYFAKEECIKQYVVSVSSMNFPNEFKWMGLIDREEDNISIISYITLLSKLANRNEIEFNYSIEKCSPFINQNDTTTRSEYYLLRKEYAMRDFTCSFVDTVLVSSDSLIVGIKNKAGGHAFTKSEIEDSSLDVFIKQ